MDRKDMRRMREDVASHPERYSDEEGRFFLGETVGFSMFSIKPGNDTEEFYKALEILGGRWISPL